VWQLGEARTDRRTDLLYQYHASAYWRAIKTLEVYLVWPHQSCWSNYAAIGLVRLQSSKKPIRDCFSRCRPFMKLFAVLAFTVRWSKLFHLLTSRSVKKCRLTSNLLLCLVSFNSWPLGCFVVDNSNIESTGIPESPLTILNTSMSSALLRLSFKLYSPKRLSLSQYGSLENPGIILVKRCCTVSISILSFW